MSRGAVMRPDDKRLNPGPRKPLMERFWSKVQKTDGCWLWTAGKLHGYGAFNLNGDRMWRAHRVAWCLTHGDLPEELDVLHRCDNPACVRPDHLFVGTHDENMHDMAVKQRSGRALFSAEEVLEIRKRVTGGETRRSIAKECGVHPSTIEKMVNGKNWTWLNTDNSNINKE